LELHPPKEEELHEQNSNYRFVPLRQNLSPLYAEMLREALDNEGIPALVKTSGIGAAYFGFQYVTAPNPAAPVSVLVPEERLGEAEAVAEQILPETELSGVEFPEGLE
jgi:hypothetical protein